MDSVTCNKMKIRLIALILTLFLLIPLAVACGTATPDTPGSKETKAGPSGDGKQTESETSGTPGEDESGTTWYTPELPEEPPFTGKTFTFFAFTDDTSEYWHDTDFTAEAINGDSINDAVYERNMYVAEKSGADLIIAHGGRGGDFSQLVNTIASGDDEYQAADLNTHQMFQQATQEHLVELNGMGTIQLDAPWWDQNCRSQLSIMGQNYGLYGDIGVMYMRTFGIVMFNKKLVTDHLNDVDLYEVQQNREWTIEYMADLVNSVSVDLDGNGEMTEDDLFGMVYQGDMMPVALICAGVEFTKKNDSDEPVMDFNNDKTLDAIDMLADLMYNTECARSSSASSPNVSDHHHSFQTNHAVFDVTEIHAVIDARPMETNFGVLCMPLFDEDQEDYLTCINPHVAATMVVPNSIQEPEFVGAMLDLLSAIGKNYLTPAFYDVTLQGRAVRDEESRATLDLIIGSVRYDLGYVASWGVSEMMRGMGDARQTNFASRYESNISALRTNMEKTIEQFALMGG